MGMALGIGLARYFQGLEEGAKEAKDEVAALQGWRLQWAIFSALTLLHIWANHRAVQSLRLNTLNRQRAAHVLRDLVNDLAQIVRNGPPERLPTAVLVRSVPGPSGVQESLAASTYHMLLPQRWNRIVYGAKLTQLLAACSNKTSYNSARSSLQNILDEFSDEGYVVAVSSRDNRIWVSLLMEADASTELQAFLHALLLQECLRHDTEADLYKDGLMWKTHAVVREMTGRDASHRTLKSPLWVQLENNGWELQHRLYLGLSRRRSRWSAAKAD